VGKGPDIPESTYHQAIVSIYTRSAQFRFLDKHVPKLRHRILLLISFYFYVAVDLYFGYAMAEITCNRNRRMGKAREYRLWEYYWVPGNRLWSEGE